MLWTWNGNLNILWCNCFFPNLHTGISQNTSPRTLGRMLVSTKLSGSSHRHRFCGQKQRPHKAVDLNAGGVVTEALRSQELEPSHTLRRGGGGRPASCRLLGCKSGVQWFLGPCSHCPRAAPLPGTESGHWYAKMHQLAYLGLQAI